MMVIFLGCDVVNLRDLCEHRFLLNQSILHATMEFFIESFVIFYHTELNNLLLQRIVSLLHIIKILQRIWCGIPSTVTANVPIHHGSLFELIYTLNLARVYSYDTQRSNCRNTKALHSILNTIRAAEGPFAYATSYCPVD